MFYVITLINVIKSMTVSVCDVFTYDSEIAFGKTSKFMLLMQYVSYRPLSGKKIFANFFLVQCYIVGVTYWWLSSPSRCFSPKYIDSYFIYKYIQLKCRCYILINKIFYCWYSWTKWMRRRKVESFQSDLEASMPYALSNVWGHFMGRYDLGYISENH